MRQLLDKKVKVRVCSPPQPNEINIFSTSVAKKGVLKCSAMLQKETVDKLIDEACGEVVKEGHAGLCE